MSRLLGSRGLTVCLVLLWLLLAAGCSRPAGLPSDDGTAQTDQHSVPFHDGDGSTPENVAPVVAQAPPDNGLKSETGLPFRDSQSLPAGTLLTVRLKNPVSADEPGPSGAFEAVMDEPVMIDGNVVVPRGASVSGRVESARASKVKHDRGYVRLTLDSIEILGKDLPIQTSSLFAQGNPLPNNSSFSATTLKKGRRLTFRLSEPAYVARQQAFAGH